jgi:hypothetical protein
VVKGQLADQRPALCQHEQKEQYFEENKFDIKEINESAYDGKTA